jgi:hypothetical protein
VSALLRKLKEGFVMSTELDRREFLKIVFATTSVVAVSGVTTLWPSNVLPRPVMDPVYLEVDQNGYIVDPGFDYCDMCPPTYREYHSLSGLDNNALKIALDKQPGLIEHLVSDHDNWSIEEVDGWLDEYVELSEMGTWEAMQYTPYGPAIEIYLKMDHVVAAEIGLDLVDGDHPGSDFVGVAFHGDIAELNSALERLGMNLVVTAS